MTSGSRDAPFAEGFLMSRFREFYHQVVTLKARLGHGEIFFLDPGAGRDAELTPNAVFQILVALLERQALEAQRSGGDLAAEVYLKAQYVMAALGDEVFLHTEWPGREAWQGQIIESRFFRSHAAGEVFFERLEELLEKPNPVHHELARIYLAALALGFQGKYRDKENADVEIAAYRRRLLRLVSGGDATLLEGRERLFPDAYLSTLDQGQGRDLPYLRPWLVTFLVVLGVWVLGSYGVWYDLTSHLRPLIDEILHTSTQASGS